MASEGPNLPGSGTSSTLGAPVSWVNPGNVTLDDGSYATASVSGRFTGNDYSEYLQATTYGFAIPSGATIDGIVCEVHGYRSSAWTDGSGIFAVKGGSLFGGITPTSLPTSLAYTAFGSSSSLWSTTWTDTDINSSSFGFSFYAQCNNSDAVTGRITYVDTMRVTVYYTAGGGGSNQPATKRYGGTPYMGSKLLGNDQIRMYRAMPNRIETWKDLRVPSQEERDIYGKVYQTRIRKVRRTSLCPG